VVGRDVVLETTTTTAAADDDDVVKCRYETGGTGGWLEGEGYAGQESHWVVFRCASSLLETDPYAACTLSGTDDAGPEFSAVRWMTPDLAVQAVPGRKAPPYRMLAERRIPPIATRWEGSCADLDLGEGWRCDDERSVGVAEALVARGLGVVVVVVAALTGVERAATAVRADDDDDRAHERMLASASLEEAVEAFFARWRRIGASSARRVRGGCRNDCHSSCSWATGAPVRRTRSMPSDGAIRPRRRTDRRPSMSSGRIAPRTCRGTRSARRRISS
jgi:hypothetical protein